MDAFPRSIILEDRVYDLEADGPSSKGRAFDRCLLDYRIAGTNPLNGGDRWRALAGVSEEFAEDFPSFRLPFPWQWLAARFLATHIRDGSLKEISGPGGQVLTTTNYGEYLGSVADPAAAELIVRNSLRVWVGHHPDRPISTADLFVSSDLPYATLLAAINSLVAQGHLNRKDDDSLEIQPSAIALSPPAPPLELPGNRYFQEVAIEADEPFCFVAMPFRESEFPQHYYSAVIKPTIEDAFEIPTFRVDEDHLPDRIDNKIYTYLRKCSFVVAELTTANPNVMYELGLAHMLGKDTVIVTQSSPGDLPFDVARIAAKQYESEAELREILTATIAALAFKRRR